MLLAALCASGAQGAEEAIERVSRTWGKPKARIRRGCGAIAAWTAPGGLRTSNDPAWLAEGWMALGGSEVSPSALRHAKGDFALFALHEGGLLLASGRAGGYRPIFVAWPSPGLVLASTRLAPLLLLIPQHPLFDLAYLSASLLSFGPIPPESTPFAGVRRVPLGEAWLVRPDTQEQRWSTIAPLSEPALRDDGGLAIPLREAMTEATRKSAQDATGLAVKVSGGLDSSLLLSLLISLAHNGEIAKSPEAIAYECVAPTWHDDRACLRSLESHLEMRAHRVVPREASALIRQFMVVDAMPAPSPTLFAAKLTAGITRTHGVDVVLTGDGGDQVLDGNPRLFGELARQGKVLRAIDGALRTRGVFYEGRVGRLARFLIRPLLEPLLPQSGLRSLQRLRRRPPPWAGPAFVDHVHGSVAPLDPLDALKESPDRRYARLLQGIPFSPWSLMRLQEEAVGGYLVRAPLLDDEFLRFVATLPPLSLLQGGFLRGLMRESMRGLVPEGVRLRETKGSWYWFVEQAIVEAGGLRVLADLADVSMLADLRLVEPKPFRRLFDQFARAPSDDANHGHLWSVLSTEAFLRQSTQMPARAA